MKGSRYNKQKKRLAVCVLAGVIAVCNPFLNTKAVQAQTSEDTECRPETATDTDAAVLYDADSEMDAVVLTDADGNADTWLEADSMPEVEATFEDINAPSVFLKQSQKGRCTLTANVMMLRRDALIKGDPNWASITEDSCLSTLWITGAGMRTEYDYGSAHVTGANVDHLSVSDKKTYLINVLKQHPEGIVIYDRDEPHAILLTDYTDGVFYCAEPSNNYPSGRVPVSEAIIGVEGADWYWYVSNNGQLEESISYAKPSGILFLKSDNTGYCAGVACNNSLDKLRVEYSWYVMKDGEDYEQCISDWTVGYEWLNWTPEAYGDYTLIARTRVDGLEESIQEVSSTVSYHPNIKGICQMPYTGEGGGYLIGFETYDNPNQSYRYEMLILDCTLLAQNKPAWIYTTGKCGVSEGNAFWTIWQPQYGYYWTLFRLYDADGNLIDERCYGFQNIL